MRFSACITLFITLVVTASIVDARDIPSLTGTIAFASNREGNFDIYIMNEDGSHIERVTDHPNDEVAPSWSPDGYQLVFHRREAGIYIMDLRDRALRQITNGNDMFPLWSPDRGQIAFVLFQFLPIKLWLCVVDTDGANYERLRALNDVNDAPHAWSPDGRKLVFLDQGVLHIFDLENGNEISVPYAAPWARDVGGLDVDWCPLGDRLAVASYGRQRGIWVMTDDGSDVQQITEQDDRMPRWSPDGNQIVFTRLHTHSNIHVVDVSTKAVWALTAEEQWSDLFPAWYGSADQLVRMRGKVATTWASLR